MKMSIGFLLLFCGIIGCTFSQKPIQVINPVVVHDTIYLDNPYTVDSISILCDSIIQLRKAKQAISVREQNATSTLAQIIYYVGICDKNPKQKMYEHGWLKRALKYYKPKK
jgi:hypothetical protein